MEPYGGMTQAGAESRANYLLKWEAIRTSREQGATSYDLWGLATGGIAHFKTGFGGREVRYIGAWDLVLDPFGRAVYEARWSGPRLVVAPASRPGRRRECVRLRRRGVNVTEAAPATPEEQADWDRRTVQAPGGHVYQSLAWAEHRRGVRVAAALPALRRRLRGAGARTVVAVHRRFQRVPAARTDRRRGGPPRSPRTASRPSPTIWRARAWTSWRPMPRSRPTTGYGERIRRAGFRPIPEIQPSRHRISLPLPPDATDDDIRAGFGKSTRQRINGAERAGLRVARYDTAGWTDDEGAVRGARPARSGEALHGFYSMLESTGGRRGFQFGPRTRLRAVVAARPRSRPARVPRGERRRRGVHRRPGPVPPRRAPDDGPLRGSHRARARTTRA